MKQVVTEVLPRDLYTNVPIGYSNGLAMNGLGKTISTDISAISTTSLAKGYKYKRRGVIDERRQ
jgi:hypothetical protein